MYRNEILRENIMKLIFWFTNKRKEKKRKISQYLFTEFFLPSPYFSKIIFNSVKHTHAWEITDLSTDWKWNHFFSFFNELNWLYELWLCRRSFYLFKRYIGVKIEYLPWIFFFFVFPNIAVDLVLYVNIKYLP